LRADEPQPSPLDGVDRKKVPVRLKPPKSAPAESLVELGLRDGRWDTIAVRPDGKMIAASEPAGAVYLWSLPSFQRGGRPNQPRTVVLAFAPDNKLRAAGDAKGNLRLWSLTATGANPLSNHTGIHKDGPMWSLAFAPDGKCLATAGADGLIKLWDLKDGKPTL